MTGFSYGVRRLLTSLDKTLREYLEAQYHIRNEGLIQERAELLKQPGVVSQEPYIESTPTYELGKPYSELDIPQPAKQLLKALSELKPGVGVFEKPYVHQAEALEKFLTHKKDLIVATGTGSGKTESFLFPILGELAIEAQERPDSAKKNGCRALLLYPMNALVSDQLARIRRLFGDKRVADLMQIDRGRRVRFGMYTSRTPYPNKRTSEKDQRIIKPLFEGFYLKYGGNPSLKKLLIERGKWPAKNLEAFYGRTGTPWARRLKTSETDSELLTRDEMQLTCPDILITNYSMLEYMLLRPIEKTIFKQTKEWLKSDPRNNFILILDEAHLYRGASGAEVALLIRRLQARLEIPRERMRCILTSASLGSTSEAEKAIKKFALDLTGSKPGLEFELIRGKKEQLPNKRPGNNYEAEALANFRLADFQKFSIEPETSMQAVKSLAKSLCWPSFNGNVDKLAGYLFEVLSKQGYVQQLIELTSGKAIKFSELSNELFPNTENQETAELATETLLAISAFAHCSKDNKVLTPTRIHLFYRGLPALYACINKKCNVRLKSGHFQSHILGRLYTKPMVTCECDAHARVYEVLTHRDCGTAFLRGYMRGDDGGFIWHEPTGEVGSEEAEPLVEVHFLVDGQPHPYLPNGIVAEAFLEISTGRLIRDLGMRDEEEYLKIYVPTDIININGRDVRTFRCCPTCRKRFKEGNTKIMDLATKGEALFANLVKTQLVEQPPKSKESINSPNGGRKVLLFSDGRQKAARLARDIPREVELDSFRQAIVLAANFLKDLKGEARITDNLLYPAFVSVCDRYHLTMFDGEDQLHLREHIRYFKSHYDSSLEDALEDSWLPAKIPTRYHENLLSQFCKQYYSLPATTIGFLEASNLTLRRVTQDIVEKVPEFPSSEIANIVIAWIHSFLEAIALDESISDLIRERVIGGYSRAVWGHNGEFSEDLKTILVKYLGLRDDFIIKLQEILRERLCESIDGKHYFIHRNACKLIVDLNKEWYRCLMCTNVNPIILGGCCIDCGSNNIESLNPANSPYIRARKGFWRNPVQASINGTGKPIHLTAEEHTAQLSQRDEGAVHATTELHELRFQDIIFDETSVPVDVLSCTTTMEVGVDIGSLVAVGLRNVPPQRENYQQRAGRAGRRGASVSSVVTYAQGGPHDSHYFRHPREIVSGEPRMPVVKVDNEKIAKRHVNAYLIQTFFHEMLDKHPDYIEQIGTLEHALGYTQDFFHSGEDNHFSLLSFEKWIEKNVPDQEVGLTKRIADWLPEQISNSPAKWVWRISRELIKELFELKLELPQIRDDDASNDLSDDEDEQGKLLLNFLFDKGKLPKYAFPTDLCSFHVEKREGYKVNVKERPQQAIAKALSEYAPGRLIVLNKETYRSGGIAAATTTRVVDRAKPLFASTLKKYIFCPECSFVAKPTEQQIKGIICPLCRHAELREAEVVTPEVFYPDEGKSVNEYDRDDQLTYVTSAQFPVPLVPEEDNSNLWNRIGKNGLICYARDKRLVIVNRGERGTDNGFDVCEVCGYAVPSGTHNLGRHKRPYFVEHKFSTRFDYCNGNFRQGIFLGTEFDSDLMLLRTIIQKPLSTDMTSSVSYNALNDALRTLAEALQMAASRHLDIDMSELSAGFRIIPGYPLKADIYMFDTLTGGAGYADQAGSEIMAVIENLYHILSNCSCQRSCYDCIQHYNNQYYHHSLDRHLASHLLKFVIDGTIPEIQTPTFQSQQLFTLKKMLELDGYYCETEVNNGSVTIPLVVEKNGKRVGIGTYPGLLDDKVSKEKHPLIKASSDLRIEIFNDYLLSRNPPVIYSKLVKYFR